MKTRAAVAWKAGAPLTIETVDLEGPRSGEVLVEINRFDREWGTCFPGDGGACLHRDPGGWARHSAFALRCHNVFDSQ